MNSLKESLFGNAKKFFITAKEKTTALELIENELKSCTIPVSVILDSGGVWLDKKRISNHDVIIEKNQVCRIYVCPTQGLKFEVTKEHIIFETNEFMVLNKPAQITVSADRSNTRWNLTYGLQQYFMKNNNNYNPTPITRLDFMVSGLVLYAKNKQIEKQLFKLTMNRKIHKLYRVFLEPNHELPKCIRTKDTLSFTNKAHKDPNGKPAHTLFFLHKKESSHYIYNAILFTGRRHQIRFHASQYLTPIIGDEYYKSQQPAFPTETIKLSHPSQIMLFAYGYNFKLYGKKYKIRLF
jgi:23S rRNA-/tRNA-specific pseudouridylate synthase